MGLPRTWADSRIVAVFMIVAGLGLVGAGAWFVAENISFLAATERAEGTVIALQKERGARGSTIYYPTVRYHHPGAAKDVVFRAEPGLCPSPFSAGERVTVAHAAADPASAKVISFWTLWFLQGAMVALGLVSVLAGRASLRKRR